MQFNSLKKRIKKIRPKHLFDFLFNSEYYLALLTDFIANRNLPPV